MSPRESRHARNQAIFRDVNERIVELASSWSSQHLEIVCECANVGCTQLIPVPLGEYRRVRHDPECFLIAPGHIADDEHTVETHAGYDIIKVV